MKTYTVRTIFTGERIEQKKGRFYIAVPDFKLSEDCLVKYGKEKMLIKRATKAVTYRHQPQKNEDKKKKGIPYIVAYFEWKPDKEDKGWSRKGLQGFLDCWKKLKVKKKI